MANKWSISSEPSVIGASIDENGNATFPRNKNSNPIEYTITYNDECSASTTVIQNGNTCDNYDFSNTSITLTYSANSEGFFASSSKDFDALSATSKPDWISVNPILIDNSWEYKAIANANMSSNQRNGVVIFKPTDSDLICPSFSATVEQDCVSCDDYGFTAITNSISYAAGSTGHVASSTSNLAALSAITKPEWVNTIIPIPNDNVWNYIATVDENEEEAPKNGEIIFSPTDSSITCPDKFKATVIQEGKIIDCTKYEFQDKNITVPSDSATFITIATSKKSSRQLEYDTISDETWIKSATTTSNASTYIYRINISGNTTSDERNGTVTFKSTDGCSGFTAHIKQEAPLDCDSKYEFTSTAVTIDACNENPVLIAKSNASAGALSVKSSCDWVTTSTTINGSVYEYYVAASENLGYSPRTCTITYESNDGCEFQSETFKQSDKPVYIDLGLPSGTLWAIKNVGAVSESDTGLLFQWGDVSGYTSDQVGTESGQKAFKWQDYKYGVETDECNGASALTKYKADDGKTQLESSDDAVVANWNDGGCMPTAADYYELLTYGGNRILEYRNGVSGVTFKNDVIGTEIFFPIAGKAYDGRYHPGSTNIGCSFWTSNVFKGPNGDDSQLCYNWGDALHITIQGIGVTLTAFGSEFRYYGCPIRAVKKNSSDGDLRFSSDQNMNSWYGNYKSADPSGTTLSFYVWEKRNNAWVAHNVTNVQSELAFRSDDENITCEIITASSSGNHCDVTLKFNGVDCDYANTHNGFTMYIAPTACSETIFVNGRINIVFKSYRLIINALNGESYLSFHDIDLHYSATTRIDNSDDGVCTINSNIKVIQQGPTIWTSEKQFGFGEILSITPIEGTYNQHNYDSSAFSDIDIDNNNNIITMTFDPSRYID